MVFRNSEYLLTRALLVLVVRGRVRRCELVVATNDPIRQKSKRGKRKKSSKPLSC